MTRYSGKIYRGEPESWDFGIFVLASDYDMLKTNLVMLISKLEAVWSFDENQRHTHNWHDKQDIVGEFRALVTAEPPVKQGSEKRG